MSLDPVLCKGLVSYEVEAYNLRSWLNDNELACYPGWSVYQDKL